MVRRITTVAILLVSLVCASVSFAHDPAYWTDPDFQEVIRALDTRGFSYNEVERIFAHPHVAWYPNLPHVVSGITKPALPPGYRTPPELQGVTPREWRVQFTKKNYIALSVLEKRYGIPKEAMVCVVSKESALGANTGSYQAFGVFISLLRWSHSDDWKSLAKRQLVALFEAAEILGKHPLEIQSSYAGAMGLSQFMPTSVLEYRADGNRDGAFDLWNWADALASTANFLLREGYKEDPRKALLVYNRDGEYADARLRCIEELKRDIARYQ